MIESLKKQLRKQAPFSLISDQNYYKLLESSQVINYSIGDTILRPSEMNSWVYLVVKGEIRMLSDVGDSVGIISLAKRGSGQLIGWNNLLRGEAYEHILASSEVTLLGLSSALFVDIFLSSPDFAEYFSGLAYEPESFYVLSKYFNGLVKCPMEWKKKIRSISQAVKVYTLQDICNLNKDLTESSDLRTMILSSANIDGARIGQEINLDIIKDLSNLSTLPVRFILIDLNEFFPESADDLIYDSSTAQLSSKLSRTTDLHSLGILENDEFNDEEKYCFRRGNGPVHSIIAVCESIAQYENVPYKKDVVKKIIQQNVDRGKDLSVELIAGLLEILGLTSQLAEIESQYITSIEGPVVFLFHDVPCILYGFENSQAIIGNPNKGIIRIDSNKLIDSLDEKVKFTSPKRISSTPSSKFGWGWFTPLLKKYKTALILVFISSLLSQLFALAIPLMLQQIIDKVLSQGNISSLNILGSAMIALALFSGILNVLRTYIFIDTTDRMDLTLGSAVIDRLLGLPLSYFEKRPVGELSQRLGELNTIRSFLTGTALMSVLNLIFASLYLVVMFIYSPFLSIIALSTFPVYLLIVFIVAPIYKSLIRKRAVAQARTQSHLIEVLAGIQTVKAQHFELTARWKWQDRYRNFVTEGFKSSALGSTAGEFGKFLNQVSSLLVLWCGMYMVLQGEFTLGQLIAFRIISGNVTSPLLQLAGLYQGLQGVQLSMERLSDILDKNPEFIHNDEDSIGQIALPPVKGDIRFEEVSFRFGNSGPNQVDNVSLQISANSFVGIVGQSGSGKSTLMKLLPRLYEPQTGRIFIDNYDICKIDLSSLRRQIGIVPQDSLLFEGTVAENIALNDPQATSDSIISAAQTACAHDFIMQLSQGYSTPLAEKGSNLSGGQRQRIAIARTILSNPNLLVLDEATSALDFNTERQLCDNLQEWSKGKTVLFITHRLSTIMNSDLIILMHEGKLVEKGLHHELMAQKSRYFALFQQQSSSLD